MKLNLFLDMCLRSVSLFTYLFIHSYIIQETVFARYSLNVGTINNSNLYILDIFLKKKAHCIFLFHDHQKKKEKIKILKTKLACLYSGYSRVYEKCLKHRHCIATRLASSGANKSLSVWTRTWLKPQVDMEQSNNQEKPHHPSKVQTGPALTSLATVSLCLL